MPGSVTLLAGDPGIGKSTLLLEVAHRWALAGRRALYVSGEESAGQIRLRAERTGCSHDEIYLAAESDLHNLLGHIQAVRPSLLIVDSVQTVTGADVDGVAGGVTQVRAVTAALTAIAKSSNVALVLVGHVTKDGAIAGPRSLEHLVDTVLHFEGDRNCALRMLRAVKNRFGAIDEVGCFQMRNDGVEGVSDPSGLFLESRSEPVPGTAITVALDGTRPLIGEVQALLSTPASGSPRRAVSGIDNARAAMITAVLDKHAGVPIAAGDIYLSTVGGMRLTDPSTDLAVAIALASAHSGLRLPSNTVVVGEVGLAGDLRPISGIDHRLAEAARLGFTTALTPPGAPATVGHLSTMSAPTIVVALEHLVDIADRRPARSAPPHLLEGAW